WIAPGAGASAAGSAAVIGHCFPLWNGFRGGKGVATAGGQILVTFPVFIPIGALVAYGFRHLRSRVYGIVCVGWVATAVIWWVSSLPNVWGPDVTGAILLAAAVSSAVIVYRFNAEKAQSQPRPATT